MPFFDRIHEKIQNNYSRKSGKQESILLDIDKRYVSKINTQGEILVYSLNLIYFENSIS